MDENNVTLMDTKLDDLTVRDAVKINLIVIAATVAIPVVILAASTAKDAVQAKFRARKTAKTIVIPSEVEK